MHCERKSRWTRFGLSEINVVASVGAAGERASRVFVTVSPLCGVDLHASSSRAEGAPQSATLHQSSTAKAQHAIEHVLSTRLDSIVSRRTGRRARNARDFMAGHAASREDRCDRPFFCLLETPGSGNVVRIVNTAPVEFPMSASVVPHTINMDTSSDVVLGGD